MKRAQGDLIVGLFVVAGICALVLTALKAANLGNIGAVAGYELRVQFDHIGSIKAGSAVKSSGVTVGRVTDVSFLDEEYVAEATMIIESRFRFPEDSSFSIVSTNLLGDQYIDVEPGGEEEMLAEGEVLTGNSALVLEHLIGKFLFDKAEE